MLDKRPDLPQFVFGERMNARTEAAHRVLVVHAQCVVVKAELRLYDIGELPAQARCVFDPQRAILVRQMHQCPFPCLS